MKNKVLISAALLAILGLSLNSYAADPVAAASTWTGTTTGSIDLGSTLPLKIKPSANVQFEYAVNTAYTAYAIGTKHTSGTFLYATSSTDTNIFRNPTLTESIPSAPTDATSGVSWTGWTASK